MYSTNSMLSWCSIVFISLCLIISMLQDQMLYQTRPEWHSYMNICMLLMNMHFMLMNMNET